MVALRPGTSPPPVRIPMRLRMSREALLRRVLSLGKEHYLQRLVSVEPGHPLVKISQRIERRLHDHFDVQPRAKQSQHPLPRRVHPPAVDAVTGTALEDDVAGVVAHD